MLKAFHSMSLQPPLEQISGNETAGDERYPSTPKHRFDGEAQIIGDHHIFEIVDIHADGGQILHEQILRAAAVTPGIDPVPQQLADVQLIRILKPERRGADEDQFVLGQVVYFEGRITSYNVCYTKLLRARSNLVLCRVEAVQVAEDIARRISNAPVGVGEPLQDLLADADIVAIILGGHPQAQA